MDRQKTTSLPSLWGKPNAAIGAANAVGTLTAISEWVTTGSRPSVNAMPRATTFGHNRVIAAMSHAPTVVGEISTSILRTGPKSATLIIT